MHLSDSAEVNLQLPAIISEWQDSVKLSTCQACWTDLTLSNLIITSDISEKHHMLLFIALAAEKRLHPFMSFKTNQHQSALLIYKWHKNNWQSVNYRLRISISNTIDRPKLWIRNVNSHAQLFEYAFLTDAEWF